MPRSALFSLAAALAAWAPSTLPAQETRREGDRWVRTLRDRVSVPAGSRLRVNAHGPVKVSSDASDALGYQIDVAVKARNEADARRLLQRFAVRVERHGAWITLTAMRGPALATMTLTAPRGLREAVISTSDGAVDVTSVECPLRADSGAGHIWVERVAGDCKLITGGGEIRVGSVEGSLTAVTGGGPVTARSVRGEAMLETAGGDVTADSVMGILRASTAGGAVRVGSAGSSVAVTTGGGPIVIGRAVGIVTARNAAGPVQVGAAGGVRAESGTGAIKLANVSGNMRVSTSVGSIMASLLGGRIAESFLSTGNGDITVLIPSNLGVTIRAENEMADTIQRIVSEFPGIPVRLQGTQVVAEGRINGGGPLLRISGTGGTIFIKRQQ